MCLSRIAFRMCIESPATRGPPDAALIKREGITLKRAIMMAAACAAVVLPATAEAKTVTYAGSIEGGGKAALDVSLKNGNPKEIVQARGRDFTLHCEISGDLSGDGTLPIGDDRIKVKDGRFNYRYVQPGSGLVTKINGKFKHKNKKVAGVFSVSAHFPEDDMYPEEDCSSGDLDYTVKKGATDETVTPAVARALFRAGSL
jgi:hypothetical protein